jgi:hypothetical protein
MYKRVNIPHLAKFRFGGRLQACRDSVEHIATSLNSQCLRILMNEIAPEGARKIASKARGPTTTGIGGSFQLANSAPPLGVMGCASAPTARIKCGGGERPTPICFPELRKRARSVVRKKARRRTQYPALAHTDATFAMRFVYWRLGPRPCKNSHRVA